MHFFNPVPLMALVEVIAAPRTDPAVVADHGAGRAAGQDRGRGRRHAGVHRQPGGAPVLPRGAPDPGRGRGRRCRPSTPRCATAGFRMGPFELIDTIGLDVNLAVSESVWEGFGRSPRYLPHALQRVLVQAGRLGRKTNAGFYDYGADGERGAPWSGLAAAAADRRRSRRSARSGDHGPGAGRHRQRGGVGGGGWDRAPRGHRHRHAARDQLAARARWPGARSAASRARWPLLDALAATVPDDRYAVVPLLRSRAGSGGSFFAAAA